MSEVRRLSKNFERVVLACSNCRAHLVEVWVTRPDDSLPWRLRAGCPFCGDRSFVEEIRGLFHRGGCGEITDEETGDGVESTRVVGEGVEGDLVHFYVEKANEHAKPWRG